ncbi:MAG: ABC transporter permease [Anaerolineaceae bacterium]
MSVNIDAMETRKGFRKWYHTNRQRPWMRSLEVLVRHPLAQIGFIGFLAITLLTILAPAVAPYDPIKMDFKSILSGPSAAHLFGTDDLGRDVFTRVLFGGRESMKAGYFAILIGLSGGVVIGLITGYFGGWIDDLTQRVIEIFWAFPTILLLLSIIAAFGPNLSTVIIAIGFASIPGYARLLRGSVIQAKNFEYVTAAKIVGSGSGRIMFKHILPNCLSPLIVLSTLRVASAIIAASGLSFLGLGVPAPNPEWGGLLSAGRKYIRSYSYMTFFPGLAIMITVLALNLMGDGLRDALDPKLKNVLK